MVRPVEVKGGLCTFHLLTGRVKTTENGGKVKTMCLDIGVIPKMVRVLKDGHCKVSTQMSK